MIIAGYIGPALKFADLLTHSLPEPALVDKFLSSFTNITNYSSF